MTLVEYPTQTGTFAVTRSYDPRGNLDQVSDASLGGVAYWQLADTSEGYRVAKEKFGNHAVTESNYEPFTGRLRSLRTKVNETENALAVQALDYSYTPDGNLLSRVNGRQNRTEVFGYDHLDRLESIALNGGAPAVVASYDLRGRITSKAGVGTYQYFAAHHPQHAPERVVNGGVTRTFFYDDAGNEIERTGGPEGTRETAYTSFNLPRYIADSATQTTTTFEYDGDHSRVIKVENDNQTVYAGQLYERGTDSSGAVTHKYRVFANGKQIAQHERRPGFAPMTVYMHSDHLGSTQTITKGTPDATLGLIVHEQTFDPWGKPEGTPAWNAPNESASNVTHGFTGHEHDYAHNLVNMKGRLYDPELGRFTTPDPFVQDPLNSQSLNRFAYVYNNPLRYTDPSGFLPNTGPQAIAGYRPEDYAEMERRKESIGCRTGGTCVVMTWPGDGGPSDESEPAGGGAARLQASRAMSNRANVDFRGAEGVSTAKRGSMPQRGGGSSLRAKEPGWGREGAGGAANSSGAEGAGNKAPDEEFNFTSPTATYWLAMYLREVLVAFASVYSGGGAGAVIASEKLGYLFGRASGSAHNIARAAENAAQLARVGVYESAGGAELLSAHFAEVASSASNIVRTYANKYGSFQVRESLFAGPGGFIKFESTWQVMEGGQLRLTTAIPFGGP
jgi:RHS repeat-associated protein